MKFKDNLKKLRKENNLSQEQLAEKLNISRQAISKWESGKAYPDIDNIILLRNIFNITLDELLIPKQGTDEMENISNDDEDDDNFYDNDDETSVNLMIAGLAIGVGIGFITGNSMWGGAGAFLGMGIGYILEVRK